MLSQPSRRTVVRATGATAAILLSGCSGWSENNSDTDQNNADGGREIETVLELGEAPEAATEVEPVGDYEYLPEENRIRTGESTTQPFPEWATAEAAKHSGEYLISHLEDRSLLDNGIGAGSGEVDFSAIDWNGERPDTTEFTQDAPCYPVVIYPYHYDRDGNLVSEPDVSFDRVVSTTPRTIEVTVLIPEREFVVVLPVVCRVTTSQAD